MKLGILSAIVVLALPLAAAAQSSPQKQADLVEALRVQRFICDGIADLRSRGSDDYSAADLAQCLALLDEQRAEYMRVMVADANGQRPAAAQRRTQVAGIRLPLAVADR